MYLKLGKDNAALTGERLDKSKNIQRMEKANLMRYFQLTIFNSDDKNSN